MKLQEIIKELEAWAPLEIQESYDNAGLIVGNKEMDVTGALLCLDSTELVIEEAIRLGVNLVIAHHPIVFSGLKSFTGSNYIERAVIKAIKHDIAIYAIHTNLDKVIDGVNSKIASKLKLENISFLTPDRRNLSVGSGMIGEIQPTDELSFLKQVKVLFGGDVRYTSLLGAEIKKVAVCGGSGSFLLKDAIKNGADVFLTSDFKYHQFFDAENKILIADIGHYEAEICTTELIYDFLSQKFTTFALYFSRVNTNPINYL